MISFIDNPAKMTLNRVLEDYKEEGRTKAIATSINVFLLN